MHSGSFKQGRAASAGPLVTVGHWDWDTASDLVRLDEGLSTIYAIPASQGRQGVKYSRLVRAIHPFDRARVEAAVQEAVARRGEIAIEYRVQLAVGVRWLHARGACSIDSASGTIRLSGYVVDTTWFRSDPAVANLSPEQMALDQVAEHCLAAHRQAKEADLAQIAWLLERVLWELGRELSKF